MIGALAAIVAMYLRRSLEETASAESMHRKEAGSLVELLHHKRALMLVLAFTMGGSLDFYTFTTYMQKYLVNTAHMDPKTVSTVMTGALVLFMCMQPAFGALSDRIGRKNNMIAFGALAALGSVPYPLRRRKRRKRVLRPAPMSSSVSSSPPSTPRSAAW